MRPKPVATKPKPFVILSETPVRRCELCHQSDCLDLETGVCSRCQGVDVTALEQRQTVDEAFQTILKAHQTDEPLFPALHTVSQVAKWLFYVTMGVFFSVFLVNLWLRLEAGKPFPMFMALGTILMFGLVLAYPLILKRLKRK